MHASSRKKQPEVLAKWAKANISDTLVAINTDIVPYSFSSKKCTRPFGILWVFNKPCIQFQLCNKWCLISRQCCSFHFCGAHSLSHVTHQGCVTAGHSCWLGQSLSESVEDKYCKGQVITFPVCSNKIEFWRHLREKLNFKITQNKMDTWSQLLLPNFSLATIRLNYPGSQSCCWAQTTSV